MLLELHKFCCNRFDFEFTHFSPASSVNEGAKQNQNQLQYSTSTVRVSHMHSYSPHHQESNRFHNRLQIGPPFQLRKFEILLVPVIDHVECVLVWASIHQGARIFLGIHSPMIFPKFGPKPHWGNDFRSFGNNFTWPTTRRSWRLIA